MKNSRLKVRQFFEMTKELFDIPEDLPEDIDAFVAYILENRLSRLSPGVMCNPPDRFDGFHTYNACCRSKEDTGRHKENLATYMLKKQMLLVL